MDIYRFIRSADVANHCRKLNKEWNTCEMAIIIYRSKQSKENRNKVWQELIDNYPDMPATPNFLSGGFDSIHEKLRQIIGGASEYIFMDTYVDMPIPFIHGDILTDGANVFVLESFRTGDVEIYLEALADRPVNEGWCVNAQNNRDSIITIN